MTNEQLVEQIARVLCKQRNPHADPDMMLVSSIHAWEIFKRVGAKHRADAILAKLGERS